MSKKWKKAGTPPPSISVPSFPRLDEFAGVWAMEPRAASALWEAVQRIDLSAHIAKGPPAVKSAMEKLPARAGKHVALIKIMGTLMKQQSSMEQSTSTVQLRRDIRNAAADPDVSAILLAIDSPGGTVAGTDDLARDVRNARKAKPVYAQIEDLGASAAYWIASQADKVFANSRTALVGSIGALMTVYDLSGMAEQKGIKAMVFSTGPLKGAGVEGTKITEEQAAYFQGIVDDAQTSFDAAVKSARKFTDAQLAAVRSGAVFGAEEALERKLIDGIQSMDATIENLLSAARKSQTARSTTRGATPPTGMEAAKMDFNSWVQTQGFDPESLTEDQEASLRALFAKQQPKAESAPDADAVIQANREKYAAEQQRIAKIDQLAAKYGNPTMTSDAGDLVHIGAHAVKEGWAADRAELELLRASRTTVGSVVLSDTEKDCTVSALQGAMILRAGGRLDHPAYATPQGVSIGLPDWIRAGLNADARQKAMEAAHRYDDMSAIDICRQALRLEGKPYHLGRKETIRAAFSGSALTQIFTTSVNAILLATFMEAPDTTEAWLHNVTDVADFKTNERPRLVKGGALKKLPRGGTADHMDRSDQAESYKIARYAGQMVVSEEDMIDDMLGAFNDFPVEMGNAAKRLRPDLVYAIILDNPTLSATARALFNTTDGNKASSGGALAAATLRTGVQKMLLYQENSVNLNITPTHLLVGPSNKHLAYELTNSSQIFLRGTTDAERGTTNALLADGLVPVAEARLENGVTDPGDDTASSGSATAWLLVSKNVHNIEVAYLRGTGRAPQTRSFVLDKGQWGMGWDVNLDIGAKAMEWRGFWYNAGA